MMRYPDFELKDKIAMETTTFFIFIFLTLKGIMKFAYDKEE